jgi:hypothetical protein
VLKLREGGTKLVAGNDDLVKRLKEGPAAKYASDLARIVKRVRESIRTRWASFEDADLKAAREELLKVHEEIGVILAELETRLTKS